MTEQPYIIEFGEIVYLRPDGCPECGATIVTETARSCTRCGAQFDPWNELGHDDHEEQGTRCSVAPIQPDEG